MPSEEREQPAVEVVPIESLTPDAANVARRDEKARRHLAASLKQFGPARSIVLDGKGIVRAGNGTLEAAQEAGVSEVLVIKPKPGQLVAVQREDWSASEATGYAIADNRLGDLKTYDETALAEQLHSLAEEGFDYEPMGFTLDEVDSLAPANDLIDGDPVEDIDGEWKGMPEFEHQDLTAARSLQVHFKSEEDVKAFADLVGQIITDKTKFIWYPQQEIIRYGEAE